MTTIAWDGKTLAADTQISRCGNASAKTIKIRRIGSLLVGGAGTTSLVQRFMGWLVSGAQGYPPTLQIGESSACVMVITPEGWIVEWNGDHPPDMTRADFAAWGSGADIALGALAVGASAARAVEAAARLDNHTGGPVTTLSVEPR